MVDRFFYIFKRQFLSQQNLFISLFWGSLAGVFSQGLNFITNIFLVRNLGQGFGELVLYTSTNSMFQSFSLVGLNVVATVLVAENLHIDKVRLGKLIPNLYFVVLFLTITISLFALIVNQTTYFSFKFWTTHSIISLVFIIIWLITSSLDILQVSLLSGLGEFKSLAKVTLIKGVISILLVLILVHFYGVKGAFIGYALSFSISLLFNFYFINKSCKENDVKFNYKFNFNLIKKSIVSCIPIFLASILIVPAQWAVNYIIFHKENGALALTIFGIANQWMMLIQFFPMQISKVVLPFLTRQRGNKIDYNKTERIGLIVSILIALFLIVFSLIFEKQLLNMYKVNYDLSKLPFTIMVLGALFSISNLYLGYSVIANGQSWIRTIADAIISISLFISFSFFISYSVILALPLSYSISFFIGSLSIYIFRRNNMFINKSHSLMYKK
jgi:PST family polysaccharide transporter